MLPTDEHLVLEARGKQPAIGGFRASVYLVDRGDLVERERLLLFAWFGWRYPPPRKMQPTHPPSRRYTEDMNLLPRFYKSLLVFAEKR